MPSLTPRIDLLDSTRQLQINSNFDLWQRGTIFPAVVTGAYTADRFQYGKTLTAGVHTISQSTDVPTIAQSGFASSYSLLATVTTAQASISASNYCTIGTQLEGYEYSALHARNARFQYWVKSSVPGIYSVSLRNASANRSYISTVTINAASTWEKKFIDVPMDSVGTWSFVNSSGLVIALTLAAGSNFQTSTLNTWQAGNFLASTSQVNSLATVGATFQIAQLGIVPGLFTSSQDLPHFKAARNIQEEVAMAQRYFEKSYDVSVAPQSTTSSVKDYSTNGDRDGAATLTVSFKTNKRSAPSVSAYRSDGSVGIAKTVAGAASVNDSSIIDSQSETSFRIFPGTTTAANAAVHLYFHWIADSEL